MCLSNTGVFVSRAELAEGYKDKESITEGKKEGGREGGDKKKDRRRHERKGERVREEGRGAKGDMRLLTEDRED